MGIYYVSIILLIIIVFLLFLLINQRNKYLEKSLLANKELLEMTNKCNFYIKETNRQAEIINNYEKEKYEKKNDFNVIGGTIKKEPIYEGKKALIGDYLMCSSYNTKNVLESLGFTVDVIQSSKKLVETIKYGKHYDIIFSNNVYRDGTGPECLKELKKIENFSTPVVIHTVTTNARKQFVEEIGFDEYIEKPVTQEKIKPILKKLLI